MDVDLSDLQQIASPNFGPSKSFADILNVLVPYIFYIAGVIFILMFLVSAFGFLTSLGDPKKIEVSKARITQSLLGLIIVIFAYVILQFIGTFFGVADFGGIL